MPRPGAAKVVVPKNGMGIAFWIDGVPGRADMVKVEVPRAIAAGISRPGTPATRNNDCAIGRENEERNEKADAAICDEGAGEHHGQDRAMAAQALAHDLGDGRDSATILHELAEDGPQQKQRKELSEKAGSSSHEGLRPVGEERLAGERGSDERSSGSEQKHAPAAKGKCHEKPKAEQMPSRPIASDALQQAVEVERRTLAEIASVVPQEGLAEERPASRNMRRKSHSALSFEE